MVKTSFKVKQAPLAGRIGSGIGQGLAEQLPKGIQEGRLQEQLKQFAKEAPGMDPIQAYANLVGIPGISPQAIQAFPELIKRQQMAQAYKERSTRPESQPEPTTQEIQQLIEGGIGAGTRPSSPEQQQRFVRPEEAGQPQIVEQNPLRPEAIPRQSWSQLRRDQEFYQTMDEEPWLSPQEVFQRVDEKEKRWLSLPETVRAQDQYLKDQESELKQGLQDRLTLLFEKPVKPGEPLPKQLSGEEINNLNRSAMADLRSNPKRSKEDVINYWANKALQLDKTNVRLDKISEQGIVDRLSQQESRYDQLKNFSNIYAETGNQELYRNNLIEKFGLSRSAASEIAFPRTEKVSSYISKIKKGQIYPENYFIESRKIASDMENLINKDDSLLAIAKELKMKHPLFDTYSFFEQLREDQSRLGLTARQRDELAEGMGSGIPTWADLFTLPWGKK